MVSFEQLIAEQTKICNECTAVIEPVLKNLAEKNDEGTLFYSDITSLSGPGTAEYSYVQQKEPRLYQDWIDGKVSLFNIRNAGVCFVIEYQLNKGIHDGVIYLTPRRVPEKAFMLYKHQKMPVPLNIAMAAKKLYIAQECRANLRAAHQNLMESHNALGR